MGPAHFRCTTLLCSIVLLTQIATPRLNPPHNRHQVVGQHWLWIFTMISNVHRIWAEILMFAEEVDPDVKLQFILWYKTHI